MGVWLEMNDYMDIYLIHADDTNVAVGLLMETLNELKAKGKFVNSEFRTGALKES